jgi:hypothetical protein
VPIVRGSDYRWNRAVPCAPIPASRKTKRFCSGRKKRYGVKNVDYRERHTVLCCSYTEPARCHDKKLAERARLSIAEREKGSVLSIVNSAIPRLRRGEVWVHGRRVDGLHTTRHGTRK